MNAAAETSPRALPARAGFVFWSLVVCFAVTLAYWVVWFFVDRDLLASAHTTAYYAFENAFPAADSWMALCALAGAVALHRRWASSLLFCLLAGSASLYLAGMDILFDLQNGIYLAPTGDWGGVVVEAVINLATLLVGAYVVRWAWRNRRALAALDGW